MTLTERHGRSIGRNRRSNTFARRAPLPAWLLSFADATRRSGACVGCSPALFALASAPVRIIRLLPALSRVNRLSQAGTTDMEDAGSFQNVLKPTGYCYSLVCVTCVQNG